MYAYIINIIAIIISLINYVNFNKMIYSLPSDCSLVSHLTKFLSLPFFLSSSPFLPPSILPSVRSFIPSFPFLPSLFSSLELLFTLQPYDFLLCRLHSLEGNGFTVIGDSQVVGMDNLSHRLKVKNC